MSKTNQYPNMLIVILILTLSACTRENWYQSAKSAQTNHCMKGPISEYDDCNQQTTESYNEYQKTREEVSRDTMVKQNKDLIEDLLEENNDAAR